MCGVFMDPDSLDSRRGLCRRPVAFQLVLPVQLVAARAYISCSILALSSTLVHLDEYYIEPLPKM